VPLLPINIRGEKGSRKEKDCKTERREEMKKSGGSEKRVREGKKKTKKFREKLQKNCVKGQSQGDRGGKGGGKT